LQLVLDPPQNYGKNEDAYLFWQVGRFFMRLIAMLPMADFLPRVKLSPRILGGNALFDAEILLARTTIF